MSEKSMGKKESAAEDACLRFLRIQRRMKAVARPKPRWPTASEGLIDWVVDTDEGRAVRAEYMCLAKDLAEDEELMRAFSLRVVEIALREGEVD